MGDLSLTTDDIFDIKKVIDASSFSSIPLQPATVETHEVVDGDIDLPLVTEGTYLAVQVVGDALVSGTVTASLVQSSDETNFIDLSVEEPEATGIIPIGGGSILLVTEKLILEDCYLRITIAGSAVTGTISVYVSSKKKDNGDVPINTTVVGDVTVTSAELPTVIEALVDLIALQRESLIEQRITNRILMDSYNIEITELDICKL